MGDRLDEAVAAYREDPSPEAIAELVAAQRAVRARFEAVTVERPAPRAFFHEGVTA